MSEVGKGFSASAFGDRFAEEARTGCNKPATGKPATLQTLARHLVNEPDHRGVSKTLRRLHELKQNDAAFGGIEIDHHKEFWDAINLGEFSDVEDGLAEITRRRTYTRPKPAEKSISIIHKAKGLECDTVIVMPCDATTFRDTREARCLFYVAISRAKHRLMLVVSKRKPSPLLDV
jgi:DNA helicase-2/ATP-dependent DNA helicase PcrA